MGYPLFREVLDNAPADLTSGERLVWAVLADFANDKTREARPGMAALSRRCGLTPDGVGKALRRLAKRGIELRLPIGEDRHGRPVFAHEGVQSRYRVPEVAQRSAHRATTEVGPQGDHSTPRGRPTGRERSAHRPREVGPQADPSPQRALKEHSAARGGETEHVVMQATGCTAEEAAAVAALIRHKKQPHSPVAFLRRLAGDGELAVWLERVRAERDRGIRATGVAEAKRGPECDHLVPGGDHPDYPQCALCRRARLRSA